MNGHEAEVVCNLVEITGTKSGSSKSVPLSVPEKSKIGLHLITRNLGHFEPANKVSGVSYSQEN